MFLLANSAVRLGRTAGVSELLRAAPLLDVLEAALREAESDPEEESVGLGGLPNLLGRVELDAGLMEGGTRRTGAVGALSGFLHPVSIARQVLERLPHVFLVGDGAARFAREIGAQTSDLLTAKSEGRWRSWIEQHLPPSLLEEADAPLSEHILRTIGVTTQRDTAIVLAGNGTDLASGTSTAGWPYKYPGRLGDSAIAGAGHYADSRYGAAACTHTGEMTIRAGTARAVVLALRRGLTPEEACLEAIEDLRELRGGLLSEVVVYAVSTQEEPFAASTGVEGAYWWWREGMPEPEARTAEVV